MKIVFSEMHWLCDVKMEFYGGKLVLFFESLLWVERVIRVICEMGLGDIIGVGEYLLDVVLVVHIEDFV